MVTSEYFHRVCVAAVCLALFVALLMMNGEALGWRSANIQYDLMFTDNDLQDIWNPAKSTKIVLTKDSAMINGDGADFCDGKLLILHDGAYEISGELANGALIVRSGGIVRILMDNAVIHQNDGAALLIEQAGKVYLTLAENSHNKLSCGDIFSELSEEAGIDGAIYSRSDLTIHGLGALSIFGKYRHGIVCNDNLVISGGVIEIDALIDGIHAHDSVRLTNMDLTIRAGKQGVSVADDHGNGLLYINDGKLAIPSCYEGLEAAKVVINGGNLEIHPFDDGVNVYGWTSGSEIHILDGDIKIINNGGWDSDGFDSNRDIYLDGGNIFISTGSAHTNTALDYGGENGGICQINGGKIIACGGSGMAERISNISKQCSILYNFSSVFPNKTSVILKTLEGYTLLEWIVPNAFNSIILSSPELSVGETYKLIIGNIDEDILINDIATFYGNIQSGFDPGRGLNPALDLKSDSATPELRNIATNSSTALGVSVIILERIQAEIAEMPLDNDTQEISPPPPNWGQDNNTQGMPPPPPNWGQDNNAQGMLPPPPFQQTVQIDEDNSPKSLSDFSVDVWFSIGVSMLTLIIGFIIALRLKRY